MIHNFIMTRLLVICLLVWVLIICFCSSSEEADNDELVAVYGTVTEISGSVTGNDVMITLVNGPEVWNVILAGSERVPELGREVIVVARAGSDNSLTAVYYDYP